MANFTTNIETGIQEAFDKNGAVQVKSLYDSGATPQTKPFFRSSNIFQANKTKNLPMNYVQISVEDQLTDFSLYGTKTKEIENYFNEIAKYAYQTITNPTVGEQKFFSDLLDSATKEFNKNVGINTQSYLFFTTQSPLIPDSIIKAMPLFPLTGKEFKYKICDAFIKVSKNTQFQTIFVYHDILTNNQKIPVFFDSQLKEELSYLQISVILEFTENVQKIKFYVIPQLSFFETIKVPLFGGGFIEAPSFISKPLFETKFSNKLFPPVIPNVNTTSYQNVNNKVIMFLSKNLGPFISYANEPAFFTKEQFDQSKQIIEKKKGLTYEPNLIYSFSQNKERYFVIYRTETKPKTYSSIIKEQNVIKRLDITKLQTSLADTVSPNTKYYYCFRIEDIDGVTSDVTLIYEIEIVDESGTIYMKQEVFKPEKPKVFKKALPFENRTRIAPTSLQIKIPDNLINVFPLVLAGNNKPPQDKFIGALPPISVSKEEKIAVSAVKQQDFIVPNSVFDSNKQFKARIQSLNSKKKFDININYNIEIIEGLKYLSESGIVKEFEVLQTQEIKLPPKK